MAGATCESLAARRGLLGTLRAANFCNSSKIATFQERGRRQCCKIVRRVSSVRDTSGPAKDAYANRHTWTITRRSCEGSTPVSAQTIVCIPRAVVRDRETTSRTYLRLTTATSNCGRECTQGVVAPRKTACLEIAFSVAGNSQPTRIPWSRSMRRTTSTCACKHPTTHVATRDASH